MTSIVVATDENGAIGLENKIPWRIKSDRRLLANLTRGNPVILGRKSYDSMTWYYNKSGRRMPGSHYIVITRNQSYMPTHDYAHTIHSMADALKLAKTFGDDIYIIGGGSVFAEALPFTDKIHLTTVHTKLTGDIDAHFVIPDKTKWHETSREDFPESEGDQFASTYTALERI